MFDIEGKLTIRLNPGKDGAGQVEIVSTRPVYASEIFQGRPVEAVLELLPAVFSICGVAQLCAGVQATEQALGIRASAAVTRQRSIQVKLETLREHVWRILMDWPELIGHPADSGALQQIIPLFRRLQRTDNIFTPGTRSCEALSEPDPSVLQPLRESVARALYGLPLAEWLSIETEADLQRWVRAVRTPATALIGTVLRQHWQGIGACATAALPVMADEPLNLLMQKRRFIARPEWQQQCRETGCLMRTRSPLLDELGQVYGNGLLPRLVARITELALLLLNPGDSPVIEHRAATTAQNPGLAQVEAARGRLVHQVEIHRGQVERYRILAPTEWNFHPEGVVSRALATLSGATGEIEQQARLLINAIDPCVGYELSVREDQRHA